MTYRALFLVPEGITFGMLTEEQQQAVQSVLGQHVLPMPGTIAANGKVVLDGVCGDNFDPETIEPLGLPMEMIGLWQEDGTAVMPLSEAVFMPHLPDQIAYGEGGEVLSTSPAVFHEPHRWAGWTNLFGHE